MSGPRPGGSVVATNVVAGIVAGIVLALPLALAACAGESGGVSDPGTSPTADTALSVTVSDGPGQPGTAWTLTCDPPGGTHPDPEGACRAIASVPRPFEPVPADMNCTQIYGGPETATITGTWRGQPVDASYRLTDGCEIARWRALAAVLGPASRS